MKNWLILLILVNFCFGCRQSEQIYVPEGLFKLSEEEMIHRQRISNFIDFDSLLYKNQKGEIVHRDSLVFDSLAFQEYIDSAGNTREMVFRPIDNAYKALKKKMDEARAEGPPLRKIDIDCDDLGALLDEVYEADQGIRQDISKYDQNVDIKNLEIIVSLLEQCGMPTKAQVSEKQVQTVWLVIQHARLHYQKKYLPIFKKAVENGDLRQSSVGMMEDRMLMREEKPQIYGSQISKNAAGEYELYDVIDPEYLNQRRKQAGFQPIEDYLLRWDIVYDVEQKDTIH